MSGSPPVNRGRLLTPVEVAERLRVVDQQGRPNARWVIRHVTPRVQLSARVIRYWEADVEAFLARARNVP